MYSRAEASVQLNGPKCLLFVLSSVWLSIVLRLNHGGSGSIGEVLTFRNGSVSKWPRDRGTALRNFNSERIRGVCAGSLMVSQCTVVVAVVAVVEQFWAASCMHLS